MNFSHDLSRRLHFFGGLRRIALPAALAGLTIVLPACAGRVYRQAQPVVVTAVPLKVAQCRAVGPVQAADEGGGGGTIDDRMLALKEAAVVIGANTVLIRSPGTSVDGTAYVCQQPVKPDNIT